MIDGLVGARTAWSHQVRALDLLGAGENVVVATGTASGKSLIFQLRAFDLVLRNPDAKVLVFYPLKALAADQHERWRNMAARAGLPASAIARIDGDVPMGERQEALDRARIVLMTPDTCQAWMMRFVAGGPVRRFLDQLSLLVLDEAHVYESVFGSNVAFLLRRLIAAKQRAGRGGPKLQVVSTTATIAYPQDHLNELTGLNFSLVNESENGAPAQARRIYHVNGPEMGGPGEGALQDLIEGIMQIPTNERGRFIAFHDSRQGVERIVKNLDTAGIYPYRSGYEVEDRHKIERALRSGNLEGVVSTSALELGIDVADMTIGLNLGVPQSRKAFRQRIGRVGRSKPGVFFVVAPANAFTRYGQTFHEYYAASVEPSYLYLGNRFIQFAHARCLVDEAEAVDTGRNRLPTGIDWPEGFEQSLRYALPGGGRPREFDLIASIGGDSPHLNYPLRQVGETNYELRHRGDGPHKLGTIAMQQAIREAYPGATYLHLGHAYKVTEWRNRGIDRSIRVFAMDKGGAPTKPMLRTTVNLSLDPTSIVDEHYLRTDTGIVAEVHLQVTESVEGFSIGSNRNLYKDLRADDPNMSRKQRDFRTTGVIVRIEEDWFRGGGGAAAAARAAVAEALKALLLRERSIAPQDIDATHTNIALVTDMGPQRITDAIVVYDAVYGGLRLSEDLFVEFQHYVAQLSRATALAQGDGLVPKALADLLAEWSDRLSESGVEPPNLVEVPDGWRQIYKPGSQVQIWMNGASVTREIMAPLLFDFDGNKSLMYSYRNGASPGMVPHAQIQAAGQEWQWALWNPATNEIKDIDSDDAD
ncbi:MAG: DEAD/DEAH box helicase [Polymorphobacter sp.]